MKDNVCWNNYVLSSKICEIRKPECLLKMLLGTAADVTLGRKDAVRKWLRISGIKLDKCTQITVPQHVLTEPKMKKNVAM